MGKPPGVALGAPGFRRDEVAATGDAPNAFCRSRLRILGGFDTQVGGDSLHGLLYLEERYEALKRKDDSKLTPNKKKPR
jgi:hypothetical protein